MTKLKLVCILAPVLAMSALSACDSSGGAAAVTPPSSSGQSSSAPTGSAPAPVTGGAPAPAPNPTSTSSPTNVAVGETCTGGDSNKLCLAIHFVTYKDSSGTPTANESQTATIIHEMNTLWAQCDIGFQVEKYDQVDPTQYGLSYGAQSQNETDQIRQTFVAPVDELLAVTTGPWGTAVNAWTNMPGDGTYGAIMEQSIVTYGNGIIYAHEFGHYLGLDHVSDTSNLMNPIIYTTSTALTSSQCQTARGIVGSYWKPMTRN